jgi:hypothetical protein
MRLFAACYVSRACGDHDEDILAKARVRNAELGLTGILIRSGDHWMQVLEGEPDAVSQMTVLIADDPRHTEFELLWAGAIKERRFAAWSMASATIDNDAWRRFVAELSRPSDCEVIATLRDFVLDGEYKR